MRRRLFFLLPDAAAARKVRDELLVSGVDARHVRFLSRRGSLPADLPEATFLQKTDFLPALEAGGLVGGFAGAFGGAFVWLFPPRGLMPEWIVILIGAVLGVVLGAWLASIAGSSEPNSALRVFQSSMETGKILCMVDVPFSRIDEIRDLVGRHHPEVQFGGVAPHRPAFR
jgi:hypothetical protein